MSRWCSREGSLAGCRRTALSAYGLGFVFAVLLAMGAPGDEEAIAESRPAAGQDRPPLVVGQHEHHAAGRARADGTLEGHHIEVRLDVVLGGPGELAPGAAQELAEPRLDVLGDGHHGAQHQLVGAHGPGVAAHPADGQKIRGVVGGGVVVPRAAGVAARWTLSYDDRPQATGLTLLVFRKTADGWQIVQDASF